MRKLTIYVEGRTDKVLMYAYLHYLDIAKYFTIIDTDGKDNLLHYPAIAKKNYLIIYDADNNPQEARHNIQRQLDKVSAKYSKDKVFLLPNNKDTGNLETLFENIARYSIIMDCYDDYINCIKKSADMYDDLDIDDIFLPNKKDKVYAYKQALGYKYNKHRDFKYKDIFDFESEYLTPLKNFLLSHIGAK